MGEVSKRHAKSYITDHLGSVLNSEASSERKSYGAFGNSISRTPTSEAMELNKNSSPIIYGFAGREFDLESGLYFNRHRMYNSEIGKFTSKDPMGLKAGDLNLYRYVGNNPLRFTDPSGECALLDGMGNGTANNNSDLLLLSAAEVAVYVAISAVEPAAIIPIAYNAASDPAVVTSAIEFMDALSGSLGGPTTSLAPSSFSGIVGTATGAGIEAATGPASESASSPGE